jgi:hypothetical protein
MDSVPYNSISLQVPFLSIGLIGSLIIESSQGQLCNGLGRVDTPFCVCNLDTNTCLSASCSNCEKCKNSGVDKEIRDILDKSNNEVKFIGDLGASATFTFDRSDFTEYHELN